MQLASIENATKRGNVKTSFRQILADSHVSAVAIVVLLLWSLDYLLDAVWDPTLQAVSYLATAAAILGLPTPPLFTFARRTILITSIAYVIYALISFAAAWFLARWVYGAGPLSSLKSYRERLARRSHA
jgi:hypothetical protein